MLTGLLQDILKGILKGPMKVIRNKVLPNGVYVRMWVGTYMNELIPLNLTWNDIV